MLAEILRPSDFIVEDEDALDQQLNAVFESMTRHPDWRGLAPSREVWNDTPVQSQVLIGMMYQQLAEKSLLDLTPLIEVVEDE